MLWLQRRVPYACEKNALPALFEFSIHGTSRWVEGVPPLRAKVDREEGIAFPRQAQALARSRGKEPREAGKEKADGSILIRSRLEH